MHNGSKYWRERTLQVEEALNSKTDDYFHRLAREYEIATQNVNKELAVFYNRLARNNDVTLKAAYAMLNARELKEFRWTVDEYIERGKANGVDGAWTKQLENASLRYRISRLEAMRVHMQNEVENLMGSEVDGVSKLMADIYTDGYYRSVHMLDSGLEMAHNFATIDTKAVEMVLSKPWVPDGRNFSERIWGIHRPKLVKELETGLTQSLIRGEKWSRLADRIAKKFGVARSRAENLVYTEGAYFASLSQQKCYKDLEVERQQFCATLDLRTSEICREMDGKVFDTSEVEVGVNAPPLHCRCRSTMVPYFEDIKGERAARDKNGMGILVPGDMTYKEWYEKFLENKS